MKCRECGKEAVGLIERTAFCRGGFFPLSSNYYEGVCEKHLKEETERLDDL